ncbi:hypothetical protein [Rothia sp. P4278]|uniref:hypothetical protein n=1 Tax=Rothia sp. P4278 TaxID=3402658 RepID=UPI003AEE9DFD
MRHTLKYCACALVLLLAVASAALFALVRADAYTATLEGYLAEGKHFTLSGVSSGNTAVVQSYLETETTRRQAFLVRADDKLSAVDGSAAGTHWGVLADRAHLTSVPELDYLGISILNRENLTELLAAEEGKTLGLYKVSEDTLETLPEVTFAPGFSLGKLSDLVEETGTINGSYTVYGLGEEEFADFVSGLSTLTGSSEENLLTPLSGHAKDAGLLPVFVTLAVLSLALLLTLVFFIYVTQGAKELGTYLILGWSKTDYLINLFKPILYCLLPALLITLFGSWLTLHSFGFSVEMLPALFYPFGATVFITVLSFLLSSLVVIGMKPIHAVRGYTPQKLFAFMLAGAFVATSAGLYITASYLDGPLKEVEKTATVQREWGRVADEYILYSQSAGSDSTSFTGQSTEYAADFYRWYASIENESGVSLVNTYYVDQQLLQQWRELGEEVPTREFWYMAASPSYLQKIGLQIPAETLERAEAGQQVFLLPDHFNQEDLASISGWLKAEALRKGQAEQDISTPFTQNPVSYLDSYSPGEGLFTWSADPRQDFRSRDVVIYVATAANMTYFESESLAASGLADSYVKLSEEAVNQYTSAAYLSRYGLADNQPVFISSESFVAGLQKSLRQYLQLFGTVTLLLVLLVAVALSAFTGIYSLLNRNKIAVLRLLGHSLLASFKPAYLLVILTNLGGLAVMVLASSQVGIILALIMLLGQPVLLYLLAQKFAYSNMVSLIKES